MSLPRRALPALSDQEAKKLVGKIALVDIRILQIVGEFNRSPEVFEKLSYEVPPIHVTWSRLGEMVAAFFPCEVIASGALEGKEPKRFSRIKVVHRIQYKIINEPDHVPEESLRQFVGVLGFMHVWPYFRAEVQSMSAKLGIPTLTMPVKVSGQARFHVSIEECSTRPAAQMQAKPFSTKGGKATRAGEKSRS